MTLWFVFALMTVAAIFAVLWPLSRGSSAPAGGSEEAVYRDQLAEIDRDVAAGLIGVSEAAAARVEIGGEMAENPKNRAPALPRARGRFTLAGHRVFGRPAHQRRIIMAEQDFAEADRH